jgi:hypothetical protein
MVTHRSAGRSRGGLALLVALTTALVAAFVLAPARLAATGSTHELVQKRRLDEALDRSFVAYWRVGGRDRPPSLDRVVDYWFRYRLAKAVLAALVLAAVAAIGIHVWSAFVRNGGHGAARGFAVGSAGVLVTALAVLSLLTVMANVQGAVAPFASLLPMVGESGPDHAVTETLQQRTQQLSASLTSGTPRSAALDAMVEDFARYHVAMALLAAIVAVGSASGALVLWKRFRALTSTDRRIRRSVASLVALTAVLSLGMVVLAVANAGTAADPAPGLLGLFEGGW